MLLRAVRKVARYALALRHRLAWRQRVDLYRRRRFAREVARLDVVFNSVSWGDRLLTLDKSCGFRADPAFARALEGIETAAPNEGPDGIAWRLNTLCWAARRALRAGGDFVECGVYRGDMSWFVAQVIGAGNIPHFYLYDSFEGFSATYSSPADFADSPAFMDFANTVYRADGLYESVRARFAGYRNFTVTKGFLPEALAQVSPQSIGYLHLDLNSARAEVAVLERIFDRIVSGGVIVFDDYGWWLYKNQRAITDAFMAARGYEILELPTGQGLLIKR
jgi:O-methyltransferase